MPEHIIGLDPVYYLRDHLFVQGRTPGAVTPEAMAEYIRCYCTTSTIHAVCEDYRAAAGIDLDMDRADDAAGHKIQAPLHHFMAFSNEPDGLRMVHEASTLVVSGHPEGVGMLNASIRIEPGVLTLYAVSVKGRLHLRSFRRSANTRTMRATV